MIGKKVYLRLLTLDDIDKGWLQWVNDPKISGGLNSVSYPTTRKDLEKYHEESNSPHAVMFAVCVKEDDRYIGNARIRKIDKENKRCTYGRLIGDLEYRGKGIGTEVLELILRYAFVNLGMNRVWTEIFDDNEVSIRSNEKAGMRQEGIIRQAYYKNGSPKDVVMMSMLREEFDHIYANTKEEISA